MSATKFRTIKKNTKSHKSNPKQPQQPLSNLITRHSMSDRPAAPPNSPWVNLYRRGSQYKSSQVTNNRNRTGFITHYRPSKQPSSHDSQQHQTTNPNGNVSVPKLSKLIRMNSFRSKVSSSSRMTRHLAILSHRRGCSEWPIYRMWLLSRQSMSQSSINKVTRSYCNHYSSKRRRL